MLTLVRIIFLLFKVLLDCEVIRHPVNECRFAFVELLAHVAVGILELTLLGSVPYPTYYDF